MALQLAITEPNGITLNYHRISNVNTDFNTGSLVVRVMSYASLEIRKDSVFFYLKERIFTNNTIKDVDGNTATADKENYLALAVDDILTRASIYEALKVLYVGAIDV